MGQNSKIRKERREIRKRGELSPFDLKRKQYHIDCENLTKQRKLERVRATAFIITLAMNVYSLEKECQIPVYVKSGNKWYRLDASKFTVDNKVWHNIDASALMKEEWEKASFITVENGEFTPHFDDDHKDICFTCKWNKMHAVILHTEEEMVQKLLKMRIVDKQVLNTAKEYLNRLADGELQEDLEE